VGRIINRFSKDMTDIDLSVLFSTMRFGTLVFGSVVRAVIVGIVTPPFLLAILLFYFYYHVAMFYLSTSREVKRIESVSASPIYAQFGETLNVPLTNTRALPPLEHTVLNIRLLERSN
jgi:ABC-type multidrug transport system fused ATPase/permease subunit